MSDIPEQYRENNGYIFVDSRVKAGGRAIADGRNEVEVIAMNKIFATVRTPGRESTWAIMRGRLTGLDANDENVLSTPIQREDSTPN